MSEVGHSVVNREGVGQIAWRERIEHMCFTCDAAVTIRQSGFSLVYTRVADEWTQPTDFDLTPERCAGHAAGQWVYVGLCVTILDRNNVPLASETLYSIPEDPATPCAFDNDLAVTWVTMQALERVDAPTAIRRQTL